MSPRKKKDEVETTETKVQEQKEMEQPVKKTRRTSRTKKEKTKPKIEFNYHDGLTWHDFAGLLLMVLRFFWFFIRILLWPVYWVINQNKKIFRFIDSKEEDRVMNEEERILFESVPTIFVFTGLVGGVIIGILIGFKIKWDFGSFFQNINADFIKGITQPIGGFIYFLYHDVLLALLGFIASIYDALVKVQDPFAVFLGLVIFGIIITIIWITISEKLGLSLTDTVVKLFTLIFGTPQKAYDNILSFYRAFNRKLTELLVGKKTLETHIQLFFKKTLIYTSIVSVWTFLAGLYVGSDPGRFNASYINAEPLQIIIFTSFVLMFAGFISGIIILMLIARWFDLMNRKAYIAPEFIKERKSTDTESESLE